MPELTPKLALKKPLLDEAVDINIINENMDKIDATLGSLDVSMDMCNKYLLYPDSLTTAEKTAIRNNSAAWNKISKSPLLSYTKPIRSSTMYWSGSYVSSAPVINKSMSIATSDSNYIKILVSNTQYKSRNIIHCTKNGSSWSFTAEGTNMCTYGNTPYPIYTKWNPNGNKIFYTRYRYDQSSGIVANFGYDIFFSQTVQILTGGLTVDIAMNLPTISSNLIDFTITHSGMGSGGNTVYSMMITAEVY